MVSIHTNSISVYNNCNTTRYHDTKKVNELYLGCTIKTKLDKLCNYSGILLNKIKKFLANQKVKAIINPAQNLFKP